MEPSRHRPKADAAKEVLKDPEPVWSPERFAEVFISPTVQAKADIILTAQEEVDLSEHRTGLLLQAAISRGLVHVWKDGGTLLGYATQPMPVALTKSDRVRQLLLANPTISGREVEEQTGASRTLVNRLRKDVNPPATTRSQHLTPPVSSVAEGCSLPA